MPAEGADVLVEVALPGGATRSARVGDQPHDAAFLEGRAYAIDELGSTISAVQRGRRVAQAPVDVQPGGVAAVGGRLAVISVQAYTVELFDPRRLVGLGSRNAGSWADTRGRGRRRPPVRRRHPRRRADHLPDPSAPALGAPPAASRLALRAGRGPRARARVGDSRRAQRARRGRRGRPAAAAAQAADGAPAQLGRRRPAHGPGRRASRTDGTLQIIEP